MTPKQTRIADTLCTAALCIVAVWLLCFLTTL